MLLASTKKKKCALLSVTELCSIPLPASQKLTENRRGAFRVLSGSVHSSSLHRRQGEGTGVFTEHTSKGWKTEGLVEIILKMGFYGSNCCCSLHSSYNLEKDIKLRV